MSRWLCCTQTNILDVTKRFFFIGNLRFVKRCVRIKCWVFSVEETAPCLELLGSDQVVTGPCCSLRPSRLEC
eukprot:260883-Amphidinium_carterae.1